MKVKELIVKLLCLPEYMEVIKEVCDADDEEYYSRGPIEDAKVVGGVVVL